MPIMLHIVLFLGLLIVLSIGFSLAWDIGGSAIVARRQQRAASPADIAGQRRASRLEYLRLERETMDHWEMVCDCPEPRETYCTVHRLDDYRCRLSPADQSRFGFLLSGRAGTPEHLASLLKAHRYADNYRRTNPPTAFDEWLRSS